MKKHFLLLMALLFLISGCSQSRSEEISVNNPYEIVKGASILSYYDTEDNISIDGFNIVENNLQNFQDKNDNIIVNDDGIIRCITVVNKTVKTFKSISVGDNIDKIEDNYEYEYKTGSCYNVVFNGNIEGDLTNQDKEDNWICITYYSDNNKITSIQIFDIKYGREAQ